MVGTDPHHEAQFSAPLVSVIIPSYNYARFLPERLQSVFAQTHSVLELIILDDGSTDGSPNVIQSCLTQAARSATLLLSDTNGGHVFSQWRRGLEAAQGRYVWIAEADDGADPSLLEKLLAQFQLAEQQQIDLAFAFCDSKAVDAQGKVLSQQYRDYLSSITSSEFSQGGIFSGEYFYQNFLSIQNIILNASAVLWSAQHLRATIHTRQEEILDFHCAGDWLLYLTACSQGGAVAFLPESLNIHRRHANSVTFSQNRLQHLQEVEKIHRLNLEKWGQSAQLAWSCVNYQRKLKLIFSAQALDSGEPDPLPALSVARPLQPVPFTGHGMKLPLGRALHLEPGTLYADNAHTVHTLAVDLRQAVHAGGRLATADCPGESWLDRSTHLLSLSIDLILVFTDGDVQALLIQDEQGHTWPIQQRSQASPGIYAKYPDFPWAGQSRFHIRQSWQIQPTSTELFLLAQVASTPPRRIGQLHIGPAQQASSTTLGGTRDVLFIQGMHRSGTSMVAGLCAAFGANFPKDLLPANRWNATGYFESQTVVSAHDQLLNALGSAWFDIRPLPPGWEQEPAATHCAATLTSLLTTGLARNTELLPITIKDPRLALTWPLWSKLCTQNHWRTSHLVVLRPVHEVAASLLARDHIQPRIGAAMWWVTVVALLKHVRAQAHALVSYKDALTQPLLVKQILRDLLGLQLPENPPATQADLSPSRSLRHHKGRLSELEHDRLAQRCDELYLRLAQCVTIPPDLDLDAPVPELDELLRGYPEWAWLFQRHHALLERMRGLRDSMSQAID